MVVIYQPDIVVVEGEESPDYTLVVEVSTAAVDAAVVAQLRRYMYGMGCPHGLVVTPHRVWVLRENPTVAGPESIAIVGDYPTPVALEVGSPSGSFKGAEFEEQVQGWLEGLSLELEPQDDEVRRGLYAEIVPLLANGHVRAGLRTPSAQAG